ncbi:aldehyde dehydrogenase, partial [Streptomyces yangpuensis]
MSDAKALSQLSVLNPATEELVAVVPAATPAHVDTAGAPGAAAHPARAAAPPPDRAPHQPPF